MLKFSARYARKVQYCDISLFVCLFVYLFSTSIYMFKISVSQKNIIQNNKWTDSLFQNDLNNHSVLP